VFHVSDDSVDEQKQELNNKQKKVRFAVDVTMKRSGKKIYF